MRQNLLKARAQHTGDSRRRAGDFVAGQRKQCSQRPIRYRSMPGVTEHAEGQHTPGTAPRGILPRHARIQAGFH